MSTMFDKYADQLKDDLNYFYKQICGNQNHGQIQDKNAPDFELSVTTFLENMKENTDLLEFRLLAKMIHDQKELLQKTVNSGVEFWNLFIELAKDNTYANKWFQPTYVWGEILLYSLSIGLAPILAAPVLILFVIACPPVILVWGAALAVGAISLAVFFTTLVAFAAYAAIGLSHDKFFHINENSFTTMKDSLQGVNSFFKSKPISTNGEVLSSVAANDTNLTEGINPLSNTLK